jgi:pseudouridine-5'-phosphate glycosidase
MRLFRYGVDTGDVSWFGAGIGTADLGTALLATGGAGSEASGTADASGDLSSFARTQAADVLTAAKAAGIRPPTATREVEGRGL